jgi:DNA-binding transcriptional regulator YdaS (Cro superfamily)
MNAPPNAIELASQIVGSARALARRIGVKPPTVSQWIKGLDGASVQASSDARLIPKDRCPAIELATGGAVTVEQLRADVRWVRVPDPAWPHPDGRPCIDVATPASVELAGEARHAA